MLEKKLKCSTPKKWQLEVMEYAMKAQAAVVVLNRPTGDGKTLAIQGVAMAREGVTLVITPTVTLTSFMASVNKECFPCLNLDSAKTMTEVNAVREELLAYQNRSKLNALVIVASPHTLANKEYGWCRFFGTLARKGVLRTIAMDEAHQVEHHGKTYRKEYGLLGKNFFHKLSQTNRPLIMLVSATIRTTGVNYICKLWKINVTRWFRASAEDMARTDIRIHLKVRPANYSTTLWKAVVRDYLAEETNGSKLILFTNFKARIDTVREHVYNAAGTAQKEFYVHTIDGDDSQRDKTASIVTFCNKGEHEFCTISRAIVISAATGSEGYDCSCVRLVLREGMPSSVEELGQELGRIRVDLANQYKFSDYFIYLNVSDYEGMRMIRNSSDNFEWSVSQLHEVLRICLGSKCWCAAIQQLLSGEDTSETIKCDNCPACKGENEELHLNVNRKEFSKFVSNAITITNQDLSIHDLVDKLRSSDDVCQKLFGLKKRGVQRFQVEALVLKLIGFGLFDVKDKQVLVQKEKRFQSHVTHSLLGYEEHTGQPQYALFNDACWDKFNNG